MARQTNISFLERQFILIWVNEVLKSDLWLDAGPGVQVKDPSWACK